MTNSEPQPDSLDEDALRRRLINRIALAGVAIVALLGGLAIIDSLYVAPSPARPEAASSAPVMADAIKPPETAAPAEIAPEAPQVQLPDEAAPEPPKPEAVPSLNNEAAPEESSSPSGPPPRQQRPLTKMPEARRTMVGPAPAQEATRQPAAVAAAPSMPLSRSVQSARHFILQMGVFNNVDNAQELVAKLQKNGMPAQIEARVQVGPFKTKAEAEEARGKLKALGLNAGLLMPVQR